MEPSSPASFVLRLRIPHWSRHTEVRINGEWAPNVTPGQYLELDREWMPGDEIELKLDLTLHIWSGERECEGLSSIYRGPVLLAYDMRYNLEHAESQPLETRNTGVWHNTVGDLHVPALDARRLDYESTRWEDWHQPMLLLNFTAADGQTVRLCDFASAGDTGTHYCSWLPVENAPDPVAFSRSHPLPTTKAVS